MKYWKIGPNDMETPVRRAYVTIRQLLTGFKLNMADTVDEVLYRSTGPEHEVGGPAEAVLEGMSRPHRHPGHG